MNIDGGDDPQVRRNNRKLEMWAENPPQRREQAK